MYFLKLDALSGRLLTMTNTYDRDPETGRQLIDNVRSVALPGLMYDILSSVDDSIFARQSRLGLDGQSIGEPLPHLFSVGGFLDDAWWHRYGMSFGAGFRDGKGGGYSGRTGSSPNGRLLVVDRQYVYGYAEERRGGHRLYRREKNRPKDSHGKKNQPTGSWSESDCPIMVHAMVLASSVSAEKGTADRLVIAGPPKDAFSDVELLRGKKGSKVAVLDAATGKIISQRTIESVPVFDGMCAARGHIILALASGHVVSLK
jgi:hypothetical protein